MARLLYAATALILSYQPATAQECTPYSAVAGALANDFGEVMQARGLSIGGWVTEIWANPTTGSWAVVLQAPNGCGQIADGGKGFDLLPVGTES